MALHALPRVPAIMFPRPLVLACLAFGGLAVGRAAEATAAVDPAQRNAAFAPAATVTPGTSTPQLDSAVQNQRVTPATVDKKSSDLGDRRAAIDVQETRDKTVREKDSHRPEAPEPAMNAFNRRESTIATATDSKKPELVTRYQSSLTAASASNMARFPAADRTTTGKINRFVFRKNAPDSAHALEGAPVTTAAGGSAGTK